MTTFIQSQTSSEQFVKPSKIVVATDLTDFEFLFPHAIAQAKICAAELIFIHLLMSARIPQFDIDGFAILEQDAKTKIRAMIAYAKATGVSCKSEIVHTSSAEDYLEDVVCRLAAKRVIMGTHARGRGQIVLGSVAHELLSKLPVPIFAVGPKADGGAEHCNPKRILHPVSFETGYEESIEFAQNLAELHGAELILMHVLDPAVAHATNPKRTVEWANDALALGNRSMRVPLLTSVVCGNVAEEIQTTAIASRADWIVLGTKCYPDAPLLAYTGTAYRVLASAAVPVLTLPHNVQKQTKPEKSDEAPIAIV